MVQARSSWDNVIHGSGCCDADMDVDFNGCDKLRLVSLLRVQALSLTKAGLNDGSSKGFSSWDVSHPWARSCIGANEAVGIATGRSGEELSLAPMDLHPLLVELSKHLWAA